MSRKTTKKKITVSRFDAAEYLAAALENSNPDVFLSALSDIAKARGMAKIAK